MPDALTNASRYLTLSAMSAAFRILLAAAQAVVLFISTYILALTYAGLLGGRGERCGSTENGPVRALTVDADSDPAHHDRSLSARACGPGCGGELRGDRGLSCRSVRRELARASEFSWLRTARQVAAIYEEAGKL